MSLSETRRDAIFMGLALILVLIYVQIGGGGFPLDDSWIHQTYGRNFGLYGEWAFLRGQPSAASTSPLYTVLLATGYALRIPYQLWTHGLGAVTLGLTAMMAARLTEGMIAPHPRVALAGWLGGLAMLGTWHLIWAAASGMETLLFSLWTLVLLWLALRELDDVPVNTPALLRRGALVGVVVALAALSRPEGVLLGGMIAIALLIARPQGTLQRVIVWGGSAALAFFVVLTPYLWLNYQLTGGILPNTASAKFEQHAILLTLPLHVRYGRLAIQLIAGGQALLIVGAVAYSLMIVRQHKNLMYSLPLLWALGLILLYAVRLPAAYQHGRYVMPALPAFTVVGIIGMIWLVQYGRRWRVGRVLTQTLILSIVVLYGVFIVQGATIYRVDVAIIDGEMVKSALWIDENLPEDDLLAIHDIGAVGYFAPRPLIDIAGLVTPELVPLVADADALWAYMEAQGADYLMAFPDQIPGRDPTDPRLCPHYDTDTAITRQVGGSNMKIYELAYDATCAD